MYRTYLFELLLDISERTDLHTLSALYTAEGIEAIMEDSYDKQRYHLTLKPTEAEKL